MKSSEKASPLKKNKRGSVVTSKVRLIHLPFGLQTTSFLIIQTLKTNSELLLHLPLTDPLIAQLSQIWSCLECGQANKP